MTADARASFLLYMRYLRWYHVASSAFPGIMFGAMIDEYTAWMMLFLAAPALVSGLATYAFWAMPRGKNGFEDGCRRAKDWVGATT